MDFGNSSLNNDSSALLCFTPNRISMGSIWFKQKPNLYAFPLFLIQLLMVITATRGTHFILRPLRLPRYISEIIGGFLLGPSVLGQIPGFANTLFPRTSQFTLESLAYLGLIYYIFTLGVEIDLSSIRRASGSAVWFALACTVPPFILSTVSGIPIHRNLQEGKHDLAFVLFISVLLSVTAFSMLAHTVTELKLAGREIGRTVLSAAILVDGFSWIGLSLVVAVSESDGSGSLASIFTVLSGAAFYVFCFLVIRPIFNRISKKAAERKEEVGELEECTILVGVLVAAFIGDMIGTHAVFGAFVYGLAIPNGPLGVGLVDRVDEFVRGMFLPLFFAISGLRTDVFQIKHVGVAMCLVTLVFATGGMKVLGGVLVAAAYDMQLHDGVSIGLLMNTKGVIELVLLNVGINKKILGNESFTILVIMSVVQTAMLSPSLTYLVKPTHHRVLYKRRTIRWNDPRSELRIIACIHHPRDPPALVSLIGSMYPTKLSPMSVAALHLVQLTGRASTFLLLNNNPSPNRKYNSRLQAQSAAITHAFESYEQQASGVTLRTSTAISVFDTMHEDVLSAAEDRHGALILLPFHMHPAVDGALEIGTHPSVRNVNERVLCTSPCTVAIIIDRGLGAFSSALASSLRVAVLFFGGADDRESLALASRMANHPAIQISLVRFLPRNFNTSNALRDESELNERTMDEDCLLEFGERSSQLRVIEYRESVVSNAEEVVGALRMIQDEGMDLLIVGKDQGLTGSRLIAGMTEWSEFPELGPIGDLLASTDFGCTSSIVVLQAPKNLPGAADSAAVKMRPERREEAIRVYVDPR
ncbi:hypothetical protein LUZ60_007765 [Juncus effusus]|nr:hypothetical protein LUZ60_007765 [Juncus effusus]